MLQGAASFHTRRRQAQIPVLPIDQATFHEAVQQAVGSFVQRLVLIDTPEAFEEIQVLRVDVVDRPGKAVTLCHRRPSGRGPKMLAQPLRRGHCPPAAAAVEPAVPRPHLAIGDIHEPILLQPQPSVHVLMGFAGTGRSRRYHGIARD